MRRADNFTDFMCRLSWNLESSISWNPHRPVRKLFYLYYKNSTYIEVSVRPYYKHSTYIEVSVRPVIKQMTAVARPDRNSGHCFRLRHWESNCIVFIKYCKRKCLLIYAITEEPNIFKFRVLIAGVQIWVTRLVLTNDQLLLQEISLWARICCFQNQRARKILTFGKLC